MPGSSVASFCGSTPSARSSFGSSSAACGPLAVIDNKSPGLSPTSRAKVALAIALGHNINGVGGAHIVTRLQIVWRAIERQSIKRDDLGPGHLDGEAAAHLLSPARAITTPSKSADIGQLRKAASAQVFGHVISDEAGLSLVLRPNKPTRAADDEAVDMLHDLARSQLAKAVEAGRTLAATNSFVGLIGIDRNRSVPSGCKSGLDDRTKAVGSAMPTRQPRPTSSDSCGSRECRCRKS